jgi:hypothetical protein
MYIFFSLLRAFGESNDIELIASSKDLSPKKIASKKFKADGVH